MQPIKMKNEPNKKDSPIGKSILLLLLLLTSFVSGCHKKNSPAGPSGDPKATMIFWETIQAPSPRNTLFHRLRDFQYETASPQDMQAFGLLMQQMADTCREKANQITSANIAGVDVDAANYGVQKAQLLVGYAKLFESVAQLTANQNNLTSGNDWIIGYASALGRHADEGQGMWWNAGKDVLVEKAKSFGNLQIEGQGAAAYASSLRDAAAQLQTTEMQTRVALTQRYGKEFPTAQSLGDQRPNPAPVVIAADKLNQMQPNLAKDLSGRKITTAADGAWTFDSPSEYVSFDALHGTNYGDVLDFDVSTHVRGSFSGAEHNFQMIMTYQKYKDTYRLMFVKPY